MPLFPPPSPSRRLKANLLYQTQSSEEKFHEWNKLCNCIRWDSWSSNDMNNLPLRFRWGAAWCGVCASDVEKIARCSLQWSTFFMPASSSVISSLPWSSRFGTGQPIFFWQRSGLGRKIPRIQYTARGLLQDSSPRPPLRSEAKADEQCSRDCWSHQQRCASFSWLVKFVWRTVS